MQASDVSGLVDRYGPEIYRYCRRLAGFAPDAEDLYQQTFLRLLELPQQLDEEQNPRALLYSVAGGIWKNEARKPGGRPLHSPWSWMRRTRRSRRRGTTPKPRPWAARNMPPCGRRWTSCR